MNSKSDPICDNLKQISYHKGLGEFEHNPTTTEISVSWHVANRREVRYERGADLTTKKMTKAVWMR